MPDPYIGEIRAFPYYVPEGWLLCAGQTIAIQQQPALFSIIGTFYGGDGRTTFKLPNLTGCAAMGSGRGPGLDPADVGDHFGENFQSLDESQLPSHTHAAYAELERTEHPGPANAYVGVLLDSSGTGVKAYKQGSTVPVSMSPQALQTAGGGQLYDNRQPFLAFQYCINIDGIYPMRPQ